ncbi:ABC transporter permease [Acuticoccus sediminis]|uniref:ABC transporter permease n=1 Tax=Acuticoccus sediminis TaxID=2184697 RepID=A0A8B2NHC0_9HYPH|nr:ABC transporter permease [Acuticoccus sediminis]RAH97323.1 ABC transporter permease [Acuticoccus sediminis]
MRQSALPWHLRLILLAPALLLVAVLLGGSLARLFELSFHQILPGRLSVDPGFTLASYGRALGDLFHLRILGRTLLVAFAVTAACAALGFPLAYFLWSAPKRWKGVLVLLVVAPLLISLVVRAYGWMVLLGDSGLLNRLLIGLGLTDAPLHLLYGMPAVVIGLIHVQMPFMVLSILAAMERIDPTLLKAAETLSASRLRAIVEVLLPLSFPGILGGATLVFTLCMTAFVTPQLLGGTGSQVMTTLIYGQFMSGFNWPLGAALAAVLSVASLVGVVLMTQAAGLLPSVRRERRAGRETGAPHP